MKPRDLDEPAPSSFLFLVDTPTEPSKEQEVVSIVPNATGHKTSVSEHIPAGVVMEVSSDVSLIQCSITDPISHGCNTFIEADLVVSSTDESMNSAEIEAAQELKTSIDHPVELAHAMAPEPAEPVPKNVSVRDKISQERESKKNDLESNDDVIEFDGISLSAASLAVLSQYRSARLNFGRDRIHLGSYLHLIKEQKLWKGLALSWDEFLASENINPHAARQYINVAKKFIFELNVDEVSLSKLSIAGISALEKAAKIINDENKDEVIGALTALSEKDAIQRILELTSDGDSNTDKPTLRVVRMLRDFYEMPPDLQIEFMNKIQGRNRNTKR